MIHRLIEWLYRLTCNHRTKMSTSDIWGNDARIICLTCGREWR